MESSPITKAYDHARAAAVATRQASDTTVASSEHTQAAGEFAVAARSTSSIEALRTLKLLEEHHRRLAELLRLPPEQQPNGGDGDASEKSHSEKGAPTTDDLSKRQDHSSDTAASKTGQIPSLGQQRRHASREMSSSIASNLASARGIRSKYRGQPLSPSVSNDQAPGNVDQHSRKDGLRNKMQTIIDNQPNKPAWVPPAPPSMSQESRRSNQPPARNEVSSPVVDDGGYTRFYNTFGSLINKISAPLAFAGLPLIQEDTTAPPPQAESPESSPNKRIRPRPTPAVIAEPDLSKIYSKATMRALAREGHGTNDSFYVVPTSGHTMSYANILSYEEKEKRRLEASGFGGSAHSRDDDDDDFVDARETPAPLSPGAKRRVGRARTERELNNTIEELCLENKSLKDMLDKLTKRLHAFEASAQNSAMALAESYRVMRPGSPLSGGGNSSRLSDDAAKRKMQEVEEQLAAATKHIERLEKDNRKMQRTLEKYREKWETLKAGAKARREAQGSGADADDSAHG
ncbi:hypothetical protein HJFPF1_03231 [Paramyrothecium foliicola]|nr:hypothetical protein HJFPF1_03231 [Paramyrothecium foliicola]